MKRIAVGMSLIALGFLGGLLAQQPGPGSGPGFFGGRLPFAAGTVAKVEGNTIVVEMSFGEQTFTRTVMVTNQTQILKSQQGTKADIKPNTYAVVMGEPDPQSGWVRANFVLLLPQLTRQREIPFVVVGRIYDVRNQGNQFGVTAPVTLNPDARIFKMTPAKLADIKLGDRIMARGRPEEGTNNLLAETITIGEMLSGFGGQRGFRFGGPSGFRRPAGEPSAQRRQ